MHEATIRIRVRRSGEQYVGECLDYPVMTHGRTLEELGENMEKALALFLAEEDDTEDEEGMLSVRVRLPKE